MDTKLYLLNLIKERNKKELVFSNIVSDYNKLITINEILEKSVQQNKLNNLNNIETSWYFDFNNIIDNYFND
jgi:hypothetical protein